MKNFSFLNFVFAIVLIGTVFNSCTVEKRRYRSGYYVNWKGGEEVVSKSTVEILDKDLVETEQFVSPTINVQPERKTIAQIITEKSEEQEKQNRFKISKHEKTSNRKSKLRKLLRYKTIEEEENPPRKLNLYGLASLLFLFLGPLAILSIPLAIYAIREFKEHPEKYYGIWAPVLTLVVGLSLLFLIAAVFVLLEGTAVVASMAVLTVLGLISLVLLLYFIFRK